MFAKLPGSARLREADLDHWPEFTSFGRTDIRVAGVSLLGIVQAIGTPCVRNAAAVVPGTGGHPSDHEFASVVVATVLSVEERATGTGPEIWVDARLDPEHSATRGCRLLGRISPADRAQGAIHPFGGSGLLPAPIPLDIRVGDLVAIPCAGATALFDVRPRTA